MLLLNDGVGSLINKMLRLQEKTKLYVINFDSATTLKQTMMDNCVVTGLAHTDSKAAAVFSDMEGYKVVADSNFERFNIKERFHYAFSLPHFEERSYQVYPVNVRDSMLFWECSKSSSVDRIAPSHLITVEAMYRSVMFGGYFAAVLPKNWLGSRMKFMRWFANNVGNVARIKLPAGTVYDKEDTESVGASGEWYLYIWCKSIEGKEGEKYANQMPQAKFRWSTFVNNPKDLSDSNIDRCVNAFRKHDWYRNSVSLWNEFLSEQKHSFGYGETSTPVELELPDNVFILNPKPEHSIDYTPASSIDQIAADPMAVHIRPGPPVKLLFYSEVAEGLAIDVVVDEGFAFDYKTKASSSKFEGQLGRSAFTNVKEYALHCLLSHGLRPYVLDTDVKKIRKQDTWLSRQLTPIERNIRVPNPDGESKPGDENVTDNDVWEKIYEDIGMKSTQRDVIDQWDKRARKMGMHNLTYEFQYENILVMVSKGGKLDSDVMGLGKTIQALCEALLRTKKKVLIVCPTKLIGEWQDQIQENISNYARLQRRNWRGELINVTYQVIDWAKDCKNMKMFNIISYERLSRVPRDAMFFVCSKCQSVVCSPTGHTGQVCHSEKCRQARADWKEECLRSKLRKHVSHLPSGLVINIRGWKKDGSLDIKAIRNWISRNTDLCNQHGIETDAAYYDKGFPENDYTVIDPRGHKPPVTIMDITDKHFKKISWKHTGIFKERTVNGVSTREEVKTPVERTPHLKWSFSEILRHRFGHIIIDEALYIKRADTNRAQALWKLKARIRTSLTGTPIRGLPQNILNILNWTLKRQVYPDYRLQNQDGTSGLGEFLRKFATYVTDDTTGKRKLLPKINNAELFQTEIAPFMARHVRTEPVVLKDISAKKLDTEIHSLAMDEEHREYYKKWLLKFSQWWEEKRREIDGKGGKVSNDLLAKLSYLINADTQPHRMFDSIKEKMEKMKKTTGGAIDKNFMEFSSWAQIIGKYTGPPTAKQLMTFKLIKLAKSRGDKVLVSSIRRSNLKLGMAWCKKQKPPIFGLQIDGTVSNAIKVGSQRSLRHEIIGKFRDENYNVMWCGLTAISEGVNIPEANWGILMDYSWEPSEYKQFIGRMIRPQQTKVIHIHMLSHTGTVSEYMSMLNFLKSSSADEGVDYMEFDLKTEMIPDIRQYADAIVDGTEEVLRAKMRLAVDELRRKIDDGEIED